MINSIIKGIFTLITKFFNFLLSPVIILITSFFPNLSDYFNHISNFLTLCFTYVRSILCLLLIDDNMIITLFNYFTILYSIYLIVLGVRFSINIYNKFKL